MPDGGGECTVAAPVGANVVATERGLVRGVAAGTTIAFRGLPYAAPPLGGLRFHLPARAACWTDVRDASTFGAVCPQLDDTQNPVGGEDCLTLNVWTSNLRPAGPMPVLVFLHGGGNNQGSSSAGSGPTALYDGQALAGRGSVVVTLNYRLGALGFLQHAALEREGAYGNWGLWDQLAALRWIQRNIGAFGGDPARVLLFGQSAGGLDVCALVSSPQAAGLFSRAILQSGGCTVQARGDALASGERLVTGAGCNTATDAIACLRGKTPTELLRALPVVVTGLGPTPFAAALEPQVLPGQPLDRIRAGLHNKVPIVVGSNSAETYRMLPAPEQLASAAQYQAAARTFLAQLALSPSTVEAILAVYPASDYPSPHAALVALTTDVRWTCPSRAYARALAPHGPTWRYFFTQGLDATRAPAASLAGAFHGLELLYVFGVLEVAGYRPTDADRALSEYAQIYWWQLAATGSTLTARAAPWPAYDATRDTYLTLGTPLTDGAGVRTRQCDALEAAIASH